MENIQTAPEILNPEKLYRIWIKNHPGMTKAQFYQFLSFPTIERNIFLKENTQTTPSVHNNIIIIQAQ